MSTPSTAFPEPDDSSNKDSTPKPESSGRSRLDREVDEILTNTMSSNPLPPIPFKQRVAEKRARMPQQPAKAPMWHEVQRILTAIPILTALACAILCVMVADASPLLARLFAIAAVVALLYPIVIHLRGSSASTGPKLWRGQSMDSRLPQSSPLDEVKRWFHSRPPR